MFLNIEGYGNLVHIMTMVLKLSHLIYLELMLAFCFKANNIANNIFIIFGYMLSVGNFWVIMIECKLKL